LGVTKTGSFLDPETLKKGPKSKMFPKARVTKFAEKNLNKTLPPEGNLTFGKHRPGNPREKFSWFGDSIPGKYFFSVKVSHPKGISK